MPNTNTSRPGCRGSAARRTLRRSRRRAASRSVTIPPRPVCRAPPQTTRRPRRPSTWSPPRHPTAMGRSANRPRRRPPSQPVPDQDEEARRDDEGPVHRPLIRASLPRLEGAPPPARPATDFTIRQPAANRHNRFRPRHGGGGHQQAQGRVTAPAVTWAAGRAGPERAAAARRRAAQANRSQNRHGQGGRKRSHANAPPITDHRPLTTNSQCPLSQGNTASLSASRTSGRFRGPIAQAAAAAGARLALTYPSERLEENVRDLAATLDGAVVLPCDVTSDQQTDALTAALDAEFGGLDFLLHGAAFAPKATSTTPFVQTSREGFRIALDVSAYSLIGAHPRRGAVDGEARRRHRADADVSRQPARLHELQRHGRRQGGPRSDGALPGERAGPGEYPRQRDLGRADQDARGDGNQGLLAPSATCTASGRRFAGTSSSGRSPTLPRSCSAPGRAGSPARSSWSTPAIT